jgi:hypothetical protein
MAQEDKEAFLRFYLMLVGAGEAASAFEILLTSTNT